MSPASGSLGKLSNPSNVISEYLLLEILGLGRRLNYELTHDLFARRKIEADDSG